MKIALDTYYYSESDAYTVGVMFSDWKDQVPESIISCHTSKFSPYIPGQFYKRELPCILDLLREVDLELIDTIIVDGFVNLPAGRDGLGMHLWKELGRTGLTVIGVAKTKFNECEKVSVPCFRGIEAVKPLWVNSTTNNLEAMEHIKEMHGDYRLPDLLKTLDKETKKWK